MDELFIRTSGLRARADAEHPKFQSTVLCAILVVGALEVLAAKVGDGAKTPRRSSTASGGDLPFGVVVKLLADGLRRAFADLKTSRCSVAFSYVGFVIDMDEALPRLIRLHADRRMLNFERERCAR